MYKHVYMYDKMLLSNLSIIYTYTPCSKQSTITLFTQCKNYLDRNLDCILDIFASCKGGI